MAPWLTPSSAAMARAGRTGQLERLGRDPHHGRVEIGQQQPGQLQPRLVSQQPAHRRRPVPPRVMPLPPIRAEPAHRPTREHSQRIEPVQGGVDQFAVIASVSDPNAGPCLPPAQRLPSLTVLSDLTRAGQDHDTEDKINENLQQAG